MSEKFNYIMNELSNHAAKVESEKQLAIEADLNRIEREVSLLQEVHEIFKEIRDSGLVKLFKEEHINPDYDNAPAQIVFDTPSHIPEDTGRLASTDPVSISLRFNGVFHLGCDGPGDTNFYSYDTVKIATVDNGLYLVSKCNHKYSVGKYNYTVSEHPYGDLTPIKPGKLAEYIVKGIENPLSYSER
jgi:hypothetical protein